jgi:hypothetical protein
VTTATVPDVDLVAWLAGEIEIPCEGLSGADEHHCPEVAEWACTFTAACSHIPARLYACCVCKWAWSLFGSEWLCDVCDSPAPLTWTERIRP